MTTPSLFDEPPTAHARRTDPQTSHDAARSVRDLTAKQAMILAVLDSAGPCDFDDLIENYRDRGLPAQSPSGIRTRVSELVARGLVEDSGDRSVLPSGRRAIVWRVAS